MGRKIGTKENSVIVVEGIIGRVDEIHLNAFAFGKLLTVIFNGQFNLKR